MKKVKTNNGITLIALVITIIVLLILAAVSIATLTGENGILTKAQTAKEETEEATAIEKVKVAVLGSYGSDGKINPEELKNNLENVEGISGVPETIPDEEFTINVDGYTVTIKSTGEVTIGDGENHPIFDPKTLTIGKAINTDKYGWKVNEYNITTDEFTTGVWRLFFQDSKYTYLITDECVGNYKPIDYCEKYQTGSDISIIGQKLNPMINVTFVESNTRETAKATAWLTDTTIWNSYINEDAVFAIGSPTIELFGASYNSTNKSNKMTIDVYSDKYNYNTNILPNSLKVEENYGIYNKDTASNWWLASPNGSTDFSQGLVKGSSGCFEGYYGNCDVGGTLASVRPVACILTSVFNSKYTLANE